MTWMIQDEVFGDEEQALLTQALGRNNIDFHVCPVGYDHRAVMDFLGNRHVWRGSVDFVVRGHSNLNLINLDRYKCSQYYIHYHEHLVNDDYLIGKWDTFCRKADSLFDVFGVERLFIRPNSGRKLFTGTTLGRKWADREIETILDLPNTIVEPEDLILISSTKDIKAEYRVLMCHDYPMECSHYEGEDCLSKEEVMLYAETAAVDTCYFPDMYYVMDIALYNDDRLGILELNNLFSAGWYNVDYDMVVQHIQETYEQQI